MEAVILIGIQGSGKTTFYRNRFGETHAHISLDDLKTRHREKIAIEECLRAGRPFVVDNTNTRMAERARYIAPAKAAGFRVVCYFIETTLKEALRRNKLRTGRAVIPVPGIAGTLNRLELPKLDEGFDELYSVSHSEQGEFLVRRGAPTKVEA